MPACRPRIGGFEPLYLASLIAYYTVMDRSSTRVRVVISVLMLAGIITELSLPGHNMSSDFPIVAMEVVTAGMAGIISAPAGPTCKRRRR